MNAYLKTALIAVAAIAIVYRVPMARNIIFPSA